MNPALSGRLPPGIIARDAHRLTIRASRLTEPAKPTLLQALGDKRMAAVLLLSFASGLPFNLTDFSLAGLARVLRARHQDHRLLLARSLCPTSSNSCGRRCSTATCRRILGRRRGWIVVFQACLAVCIGAMGFCSPTEELMCWRRVALCVAFLSASQDIVIDAYRVDTIPRERARARRRRDRLRLPHGSDAGGHRARAHCRHLGWQSGAFLLVAVLMAATMFATFWAPEPDRRASRPDLGRCGLASAARAAQSRRASWGFLLLVLLYKVGDAFALSLVQRFHDQGRRVLAG